MNVIGKEKVSDSLKITSFIVKIWLEGPDDESREAGWQCQITHVESGERKHVKKLDEITYFILLRLQRMGVNIGRWLRLKLWLKQVVSNRSR